jgi:hypothetical protein
MEYKLSPKNNDGSLYTISKKVGHPVLISAHGQEVSPWGDSMLGDVVILGTLRGIKNLGDYVYGRD